MARRPRRGTPTTGARASGSSYRPRQLGRGRAIDTHRATQTHHLAYCGSAASARRLAGDLEAAGLRVDWIPPERRRESPTEGLFIAPLAVMGDPEIIARVLADFRGRHPAAEVEWRDGTARIHPA